MTVTQCITWIGQQSIFSAMIVIAGFLFSIAMVRAVFLMPLIVAHLSTVDCRMGLIQYICRVLRYLADPSSLPDSVDFRVGKESKGNGHGRQ